MATVNHFYIFDAFKSARAFAKEFGSLLYKPPLVHRLKLRVQIEGALVSILSNFAEGFERDGRSEFLSFLSYSKGSLGEAWAQLIYCYDQELISAERYERLEITAQESSNLLGGPVKLPQEL